MNRPSEQERPPVNPVEMQRQLQASPGYRANALIATVHRYSYILQGNIAQYNSLVNKMQDPGFAIPLLAERDRDSRRHDALLAESERLLHNVVLALKTRIDLLRVFMEKYFADDQDFTTAYKAEIKQAFNSDSARFLEKLRNHITHHLLPVTRSFFSVSSAGPFSFTVVLDAQALLEWEWPAPVRQWIERQSPNVMVAEAVTDYGERAAHFDNWLIEKIREKYSQELSDFQAAAEAYNRAVTHFFAASVVDEFWQHF